MKKVLILALGLMASIGMSQVTGWKNQGVGAGIIVKKKKSAVKNFSNYKQNKGDLSIDVVGVSEYSLRLVDSHSNYTLNVPYSYKNIFSFPENVSVESNVRVELIKNSQVVASKSVSLIDVFSNDDSGFSNYKGHRIKLTDGKSKENVEVLFFFYGVKE